MKTLNERYDYGLELFLLSIDEGITGYRDDSLEVRYMYRVRTCIHQSCDSYLDRQAQPTAVRHSTQNSLL
jgi:tRNA(Ile)-lysidine synthase TilS/MesJ